MSGRLEEEYREFAGSRGASLHRTAYLLCGDWHLASDLVQETFVQAFRHGRRVQRADNQNAYVKRILINEFKRHWQRYGGLPVRAATDHREFVVPDVSDEVVNRSPYCTARPFANGQNMSHQPRHVPVSDPGAVLVAGFFGPECVFEVDAAPVGDGDQQNKRVGGFVGNVSDAASRVLGLAF
jgi:hypothetical protein